MEWDKEGTRREELKGEGVFGFFFFWFLGLER